AQRVLLAEHAQGRRVQRVRAPGAEVLRNTTPQGLGRALKGRRLARPRRHGRWLVGPTEDGPTLVLHFDAWGRTRSRRRRHRGPPRRRVGHGQARAHRSAASGGSWQPSG
ncbi:MAG: Fpg/Nei family DNA glycosylase, partial [Luteitalea sp.]|nr:Fpg/Nei family DNA glycosylase [Luteitalea sp.]